MNFEMKDWILLVTPIVIEGILIFLLQAYFNNKFKRIEKKIAIRDNVVHTFLEELMDLRLQLQKTFHRGEAVADDEIQQFINLINPIFIYFEANKSDLKKFSAEIHLFYESWIDFVGLWNSHAGQTVNNEFANEIKGKLAVCEKNTDDLIQAIRNKGF